MCLPQQFPVSMDPCLWEPWNSTGECSFGSFKLLEQNPISAGVPFISVLPHSLCSEALKFFKSSFKLSAFQYCLTIKEPQFKPSSFLFQLRFWLLCSSRNVLDNPCNGKWFFSSAMSFVTCTESNGTDLLIFKYISDSSELHQEDI